MHEVPGMETGDFVAQSNIGEHADPSTQFDISPVEYAQRGWRIVPLHTIKRGNCTCKDGSSCKNAGKHPRTANGVKDATADPEVVRRWMTAYPETNWGLACGAASGVLVIDIDTKHDGFASWQSFADEHGIDLRATLTATSGGGGRHYFLTYTEGVRSRSAWLPGVDVRSDGGYVVLPPGRHVSGGRYRWDNLGAEVLEAPVSVVESIRSSSTTGSDRDALRDSASILDGIPEGQRDDTLFRWACRLRRQHASDADGGLAVVRALILEAARRSGFPERDALAKVAQAFKQDHSEDEALGAWVEQYGALPPRSRLNLVTASEMRNQPVPEFVIDGVLPKGSLFQVFGQTGQFKSFVLLDMALSVTNGIPWMDHGVAHRGSAALILGEGGFDAGMRLNAWLAGNPNATEDGLLYSVEQQLDLMSHDDVDAIIDDLLAQTDDWRLIVFDTQADHMPSGDEDKSKDFTVVKRSIQRIAHETGAAVGLVHHTGWDKSRERGSSRQRQALDVVMQVENQVIKNIKMKGGAPPFADISFVMEQAAGSVYVRKATLAENLGKAVDSLEAILNSDGVEVARFLRDYPDTSVNALKVELKWGHDRWLTAKNALRLEGYLTNDEDARGREKNFRLTDAGREWLAKM